MRPSGEDDATASGDRPERRLSRRHRALSPADLPALPRAAVASRCGRRPCRRRDAFLGARAAARRAALSLWLRALTAVRRLAARAEISDASLWFWRTRGRSVLVALALSRPELRAARGRAECCSRARGKIRGAATASLPYRSTCAVLSHLGTVAQVCNGKQSTRARRSAQKQHLWTST